MQAKQHQILSTGRPVATPVGHQAISSLGQQQQRSQVNLSLHVAANTPSPAAPTMSAGAQPSPQEFLLSASAAGTLVQQPAPPPLVSSQPGMIAPRLAGNHHPPGKQPVQTLTAAPAPIVLARTSDFSANVAVASAAPGPSAQPPPRPAGGIVKTPQQVQQQQQPPPPSAVSSGPPPGIPPLTDVQKRIVAEFKAKIANLPLERQQTYIAQNKMDLIRRLNFQPAQLQILQGGRSQLLPLAVANQSQKSLAAEPSFVAKPPPQPPTVPTHPPQGLAALALQQQSKPAAKLLPLPAVIPPPADHTIPLAQQQQQKLPDLPVIRAAPPAPVLPPPISKAKKIAWVESQIKKDQQEAVNPNYQTPFRSREDACKRLLRYHVFEEPAPTDLMAGEMEFERKSEQLVSKYHSMLSKYHILLLQESTRLCSSSEEVMLARYWEAEERGSLAREKEEYVRNNARIEELKSLQAAGAAAPADVEELEQLLETMEPTFPPVPAAWAAKYEQVVGRPLDLSVSTAAAAAMRRKEAIKQRVFTRKVERNFSPQPQESRTELSLKKEQMDDEDDCGMPQLEDQREFVYRSRHVSRHAATSPVALPSACAVAAKRLEVRVSLTNVLRRDMSSESAPFTSTSTALATDSPGRPHSSSAGPFSPESGMGGVGTSGAFVGLKFNRTSSGRWSASLKRDLEDDEDETEGAADHMSQQQHLRPTSSNTKRSRLIDAPASSAAARTAVSAAVFSDFSDSDEDFSLADVGGGDVVQSMLDRDDDDEDDDDEDDDDDTSYFGDSQAAAGAEKGNFRPASDGGVGKDRRPQPAGRPRTETPGAGSDNDSVQNAINSILELHQRGDVQTPDDLNNLTGLLDSMEEDDEDPTLDAAVKSIL
jgi:hypothetical protein